MRLLPLSLLAALTLVSGVAAAKVTEQQETCAAVQKEAMKAVVLGGTGAIGRELVGQLLTGGKWNTVVTVGRREVTVPDSYTDVKGKLEQRVVDMDNMEQAADAFQGANAVFCALGTTRKDAGSAEAFKKVDYEYVAKSAELARQANVPHFSLVTSVGANPKIWASDLAPFHGLLYAKTKGLAEEAVKAQGFERVSIIRPGLLDRGDKTRGIEKVISAVMSSIKVADVAKVMLLDAEREAAKPGVAVYEMASLQRAAKNNVAPE